MIIYYSGTGNSKYVAERIAKGVGEECLSLFDKLQNKDYSQMVSNEPWVVVSPTYAWQIPHILSSWLKKAVLTGNRKVYFVMTCGVDIGNAEASLKKICELRDMEYMGCKRVVMPENYIAMFDAPEQEEALKIIDEAENDIDDIIYKIKSGKRLIGLKISVLDMIKSSLVNFLFYPLFVRARAFKADENCIGCGKCAKSCVMNNISIEDGKPVWGNKCTHCMACICGCPENAIEYGKKSVGKPRYMCPK